MTPSGRAALIEAATTAYRSHTPAAGLRPHPAWFDLDEGGRREAFEAALQSRTLEAALDPRGLSTTGQAVLARIPRRSWPHR
jgi:hypothetical protein